MDHRALVALLIGMLCWSVGPVQAAESNKPAEGLVIDSAADLRALTSRSVAGHLLVQSDQLETLHGLEQLEYIGGDLSIEHCDSLQSLVGLNHVKRIGGSLRIRRNPKLVDLAGLRSLEELG
ncbi:MAG: hypothetical protein OXI35_14980, partial [Gemmatimonadota bacterium]|nr:hypothetical protein [Gemmatimonadota bacterium]